MLTLLTVLAQDAGMDGGMGTAGTILYLVFVVALIAALWKVFVKAGQPGWAAIVPIYNYIVLLKIAGRPIWWIILFIIPVVNIVVIFMVLNDISKSFGHGIGFTLGLIFLAPIFWLMLGFGSSQYRGPAAAS